MSLPADPSYSQKEGRSVIYFAGGCFWGVEKAFSSIHGVTDTECGYANGYALFVPDYLLVCSGKFGYIEAVRVEYDPDVVSIDRLLFAFFLIIDPTSKDKQGNDVGHQYRTGIYWIDDGTGEVVERYVDEERKKHSSFYTEIGPLERFSVAESEHQDYLERNPQGYCHISKETISSFKSL